MGVLLPVGCDDIPPSLHLFFFFKPGMSVEIKYSVQQTLRALNLFLLLSEVSLSLSFFFFCLDATFLVVLSLDLSFYLG